MTITNTFGQMPLERIWVNRSKRQRAEADPEAGGLLQSIALRGVIMPVILEEEPDSRGYHILYAGERRYAASLQLGLADIPFRFARAPTEKEVQLIEFEENAKRRDLTWQETLQAVVGLHRLLCEENSSHTYEETAVELGWSDKSNVRKYHFVHESWLDDAVRRCATVNEAYNLLLRRQERARASALEDWLGTSGGQGEGGGVSTTQTTQGEGEPNGTASRANSSSVGANATPVDFNRPGAPGDRESDSGDSVRTTTASAIPRSAGALSTPSLPIVEGDFRTWAAGYGGQRFNLIHCDFPYGINFGTSTLMGGSNRIHREEHEIYADQGELYDDLLATFVAQFDRFASESCHVMFWYSNRVEIEAKTRAALLRIPGFAFLRHPLIWHKSDNAGFMTPGTPRHVYETCLVGGRGDRPIVKYVSDAYSAPSDNSLHMSAKPEPMLRYFMGMFCDEHSRVLDPTCGSGSALRAAESLRAERVLGLETNPEMVRVANVALLRARTLRKAAAGEGGK